MHAGAHATTQTKRMREASASRRRLNSPRVAPSLKCGGRRARAAQGAAVAPPQAAAREPQRPLFGAVLGAGPAASQTRHPIGGQGASFRDLRRKPDPGLGPSQGLAPGKRRRQAGAGRPCADGALMRAGRRPQGALPSVGGTASRPPMQVRLLSALCSESSFGAASTQTSIAATGTYAARGHARACAQATAMLRP